MIVKVTKRKVTIKYDNSGVDILLDELGQKT